MIKKFHRQTSIPFYHLYGSFSNNFFPNFAPKISAKILSLKFLKIFDGLPEIGPNFRPPLVQPIRERPDQPIRWSGFTTGAISGIRLSNFGAIRGRTNCSTRNFCFEFWGVLGEFWESYFFAVYIVIKSKFISFFVYLFVLFIFCLFICFKKIT